MKFSIFNFQFSIKSEAGFTLTEMIIGIGLFVTAVLISLGAVVGLFDANNKSQTLFSATSNIGYVLESVTRNARFGANYHCETEWDYNESVADDPKDCNNTEDPGRFFAVKVYDAAAGSDKVIGYRFNAGAGSIEAFDDVDGIPPWTWRRVTGTDIHVEEARFYVSGTAPGDEFQPRVIIIVKGYSGSKPSSKTEFDIETQVSQRNLDL